MIVRPSASNSLNRFVCGGGQIRAMTSKKFDGIYVQTIEDCPVSEEVLSRLSQEGLGDSNFAEEEVDYSLEVTAEPIVWVNRDGFLRAGAAAIASSIPSSERPSHRSTPAHPIPANAIPANTVPEDIVPANTAPVDTIPIDTEDAIPQTASVDSEPLLLISKTVLSEDAIAPSLPSELAISAEPAELSEPSERPTQTKRKTRRKKNWSLPLLWLTILAFCSGIGLGATIWLMRLPPVPDCQELSSLAPDSERLYCAQQAADSGQLESLVAALTLAAGWSAEHPLYGEAQELMAKWSDRVLAIARQKVYQGELQEAITIASKIPKNSPTSEAAQAAIAEWQDRWNQGQEIYDQAQVALKARNWDEASEKLRTLTQVENPYWQQQGAQKLAQQLAVEKLAWQLLTQARKLAEENTPQKLADAVAQAQKIDTQSYAWGEAKADINRWNQALLDISFKRWEDGQWDGAIAAAQLVPPDSAQAPEAKDLIQFSHAQKLANQDKTEWEPSSRHMWGLMEAVAAVRQIGAESSLYPKAQAQITSWQAQLEDLTQLKLASATANLGQHLSLKIAIAQAETINSARPRRLQAQTLIAHWRQEMERIEDRPYLENARQLAKPAQIEDYKAAIALVSQVRLGRALRVEAQTLIADWTNQIEILEDKPLLDEANALANRGRLGAAIRAAEKIQPDRALYSEARAAIRNWNYQIRIAQDRSTLNSAYALANQGRLSEAISVASGIGYGRPLYREAQGAIAGWAAERDQIWSTWEQENQVDSGYSENGSEDDYDGAGDYSE